MSTNIDEVHKQQEIIKQQLEAQKRKTQMEQEQEQAKKQLVTFKLESKDENEKLNQAWSESYKNILEQYQEFIKKNNRANDPVCKNNLDKGILTFKSREEAIEFFQAAASKNQKFLCSELGPDGKPTGFSVLSCGTGKLYQGNFDDIKNALQTDLSEATSKKETNNITLLKEGLSKLGYFANKIKPTEPGQESSPPTPTPLPTVPKL